MVRRGSALLLLHRPVHRRLRRPPTGGPAPAALRALPLLRPGRALNLLPPGQGGAKGGLRAAAAGGGRGGQAAAERQSHELAGEPGQQGADGGDVIMRKGRRGGLKISGQKRGQGCINPPPLIPTAEERESPGCS